MSGTAIATAITFFAFSVMFALGVPCQPGDVEDSSRARCFLVSDVTLSWTEALDTCTKQGATLLKMDEEDLKFLVNGGHIITSKYYWIGMNDREAEGSYKWADGTPVTWTHWRADQPNDADQVDDQDCVCLDNRQEWQDKDCSRKYYFICERVRAVNLTYVRHSSRARRSALTLTSASCLLDCVLHCDVTTSCLGVEFSPAAAQANCQLFALSSSGSTAVSPPRLYFDRLG